MRTQEAHKHSVDKLQFLGYSKLASGSSDKTIKIWDIESGSCISTLEGHKDFVNTLQFLGNAGSLFTTQFLVDYNNLTAHLNLESKSNFFTVIS